MNRIIALIFIFLSFSTYSQNYDTRTGSPYDLSWKLDGPWLGGSLALNAVGFYLIQEKKGLSEEALHKLSKEDIWGVDRWAAGNYSKRADDISYYPFYGSFAMPFVMMVADPDQTSHAGQISVLFIEAMATTGALYSISAGAIHRSRPLVYNTGLPEELRTESGAQRSFFGGHTAATATATFFTAKVFNDFHPDSWAKPYVWTAAAAVPAWVAYLRHKAGKHFLTDNLVGYGVGALSGILIPELHKKENAHISLTPSFGNYMGVEYQGLSFTYEF